MIKSEIIEKFTRYFAAGCKPQQKIGVEIEHFVVKKDTHESVSYYGKRGVQAILERLKPYYTEGIYEAGQLLGLVGPQAVITLEPGSQLEISMVSCETVEEAERIYTDFLQQMTPILEEYSYELLTQGYLPKSTPQEIELIPKKRYEFMDDYFKKTGTSGIHMMRGTASTQVSVDYASEADFVKKYRVANLLIPFLYLLTENARRYTLPGKGAHIGRAQIWQDVDQAREGVLPGVFDEGFGFEAYARAICDVPAIFIPHEGEYLYTKSRPIGELAQTYGLGEEEIAHYLSMVFYDIRLKQYIEIRPADSMPLVYDLAYAALIKTIFYHSELLSLLSERWSVTVPAITEALESIMRRGYDAVVYGQNIYESMQYLLQLVYRACPTDERKYLLPFISLVE
ncbi:MAG: glutamate-cysteine ligase family protein [Lachnospiraceae bacterium]